MRNTTGRSRRVPQCAAIAALTGRRRRQKAVAAQATVSTEDHTASVRAAVPQATTVSLKCTTRRAAMPILVARTQALPTRLARYYRGSRDKTQHCRRLERHRGTACLASILRVAARLPQRLTSLLGLGMYTPPSTLSGKAAGPSVGKHQFLAASHTRPPAGSTSAAERGVYER